MSPELSEIASKIAEHSERKLSKISKEELDLVKTLIASYVDQLVSKVSHEEAMNLLSEPRNNILHITAKFGEAEQLARVIELIDQTIKDSVGNGVSAVNAKDAKYYLNLRDTNFFTPLHYAARNGWLNVVALLLENGVEKDPKVSPKDREWTPVHYAAKGGHLEVVKLLLSCGVDKETKTAFGLTPLVVAAEFGHAELLQFLLSLGANKNVKTISENHGMTALHYGAVGGYPEVVALLVKEGIDKEVKTTSGLTPLHFAASSGNVAVAAILLKSGANIFERTPSNENVLYIAASKGQAEMVSFLLQWGIDELDVALKIAKQQSNEVIVKEIELYQKAIKNLFNFKKLPTDFGGTLQSFTKKDLHDSRVVLEEGNVLFNGYGISNLRQKVGIFGKEKMGLTRAAEKKGANGLADSLRFLEKTIGLYNKEI